MGCSFSTLVLKTGNSTFLAIMFEKLFGEGYNRFSYVRQKTFNEEYQKEHWIWVRGGKASSGFNICKTKHPEKQKPVTHESKIKRICGLKQKRRLNIPTTYTSQA